MLAHSPRDRSRSPHHTNGTAISQTTSSSSSIKHSPSAIHSSNQNETSSQLDTISNNDRNANHKAKKENESQLRTKNLKSFIQTLITEPSSLGSTYDEQLKSLENACVKEYRDLSLDRIRRMIRSVFKSRKPHQSSSSSSSCHSHTTNAFLHQDHTNILPTTDRFNSNENNNKKNRSNSTTTTKTSDLSTPSAATLSALDADFLRHAFSQQFRPSLDLSAYFSAAAAATSNGTGSSSSSSSSSSLFRPNFSPSNFLQSLTAPPPPLPPTLVSPHPHTNGSYQRTNDSSTTKSSKQMKLSSNETSSIKVLVNAYREAASYLTRSADELEQLI